MIVTNRLGIVTDCFPDPNGQPDLNRIDSANDKLIYMVKKSGSFPIDGKVRIIDIGCGMEGSDFVNRYREVFPQVKTFYLDSSYNRIEKLKRNNKVCADATQIPFSDESFDIAYFGNVISEGILKNHWYSKDISFRIAKECHRILKQRGLFIFTYTMGDKDKTLTNLSEIGYKELKHLQKILWFKGISTDIYSAIK